MPPKERRKKEPRIVKKINKVVSVPMTIRATLKSGTPFTCLCGVVGKLTGLHVACPNLPSGKSFDLGSAVYSKEANRIYTDTLTISEKYKRVVLDVDVKDSTLLSIELMADFDEPVYVVATIQLPGTVTELIEDSE